MVLILNGKAQIANRADKSLEIATKRKKSSDFLISSALGKKFVGGRKTKKKKIKTKKRSKSFARNKKSPRNYPFGAMPQSNIGRCNHTISCLPDIYYKYIFLKSQAIKKERYILLNMGGVSKIVKTDLFMKSIINAAIRFPWKTVKNIIV